MRHERSDSLEEYLEEMYRSEIENKEIGTKDLAKSLKIKMPSVSEMLLKLKKGRFIDYRVRGSIKLTKKGRKKGKMIYKKFARIRGFLEDLGMDAKEAERDACILEHAISEKLLKLIEKRIAKE